MKKMKIKVRLLGLCVANGGARRETEVSRALSPPSLEAILASGVGYLR